MNNTPTPRTDKAAYYMGREGEHRDSERWCDLLNESRAIERELATVTEQRDEAREELFKTIEERRQEAIKAAAAKSGLLMWQNCAEDAERELAAVTEQRDRLKEAMQEMWPFIEEDDYPAYNASSFTAAIKKYKVALQSLNQPTP